MLTRADVIRMAREVGASSPLSNFNHAESDLLERFAAAAYAAGQAAEREACANLCDQFAELMRSGKAGDQLTDQLLDLQAKTGDDLATIIRARGEKG